MGGPRTRESADWSRQLFGIKFIAWPRAMCQALGREGPTEDLVATQASARQDFVDTRPAATYILTEPRQNELQFAEPA